MKTHKNIAVKTNSKFTQTVVYH